MTNPPEADFILFYFIYLLEIGAGSTSRLPHAEQEVTDHITALSSGSERADMDVWIHAILVDYNILVMIYFGAHIGPDLVSGHLCRWLLSF